MAVFIMNYTQSREAAKANIKYIQHRAGKTEGKSMTHSHCCELAEISNPEQLWYFKTYHDLDCEIYTPEYWLPYYTGGGWSSHSKAGNKVVQKDKLVNNPTVAGDSKVGTPKGNGRERITRTLFGWDGAVDRQDAYRMVDEAEKGSSYFRIKISPDPKTEDTKRDLHLREVTETIMQTFEERIRRPVQWVAAEHDDHTPKRHVHVLAVSRGRLNRQDLHSVIQKATQACLEQRKALDLAQEQTQEREGDAWERSH